MKKSVELKKELETLRNEIKSLKDSGKIEEAHAKLNGLKELENKRSRNRGGFNSYE